MSNQTTRNLFILGSLFLFALLFAYPDETRSEEEKPLSTGKLKVVFHINENGKWDTVFTNVANLLEETGQKKTEAVVLANGPAVAAFGNNQQISTMADLAGQGVIFLVCNQSLKKLCKEKGDLCNKEDLPKLSRLVASGVTELAKRQAGGFAYIKP